MAYKCEKEERDVRLFCLMYSLLNLLHNVYDPNDDTHKNYRCLVTVFRIPLVRYRCDKSKARVHTYRQKREQVKSDWFIRSQVRLVVHLLDEKKSENVQASHDACSSSPKCVNYCG